jgi:hypothetical protein
MANIAMATAKPEIAAVFLRHAAKERPWEYPSIRVLREIRHEFIGGHEPGNAYMRREYLKILREIERCFAVCIDFCNLDDDRSLQRMQQELAWEIEDQEAKLEDEELEEKAKHEQKKKR